MIDKNIPLPDHFEGYSATMKVLEIGDSFLVPADKRSGMPTRAKQIGIEIVTKKQPDGMVRVWRTK